MRKKKAKRNLRNRMEEANSRLPEFAFFIDIRDGESNKIQTVTSQQKILNFF